MLELTSDVQQVMAQACAITGVVPFLALIVPVMLMRILGWLGWQRSFKNWSITDD